MKRRWETAYTLTPHETAILALGQEGLNPGEIAARLGVTRHCVYHARRIAQDKERSNYLFQHVVLNQTGHLTPLSTAHGRKMDDFIR